jgi:glutamyl-tRNA reductase
LIDLAVPRDIDPACREVTGVVVRDVDDVQTIADRNASGREVESRRAELLVAAELARFESWLGSLEVLPTVASLRGRADEIVRRVLTENEGRFSDLSEKDRKRVESMARAVASRILHEPTLRLKRAAEDTDAYQQVAALRDLFGLDSTMEPEGTGAEVTQLHQRSARSNQD